MPTGYTAGILDGTTKNFKEFATLCMRAFGATIHMRDEGLNKEYEARIPSTYHSEQIEKSKEKIEQIRSFTDEQIVVNEKERLLTEQAYYENSIVTTKEKNTKLISFLIDAQSWVAPTSTHAEFKVFMINQITSTIEHDGDTKYYDERLTDIKIALMDIDPSDVRNKTIEAEYKSIIYHTKEEAAEQKRCADSNKWVADVLSSFTE